MTERIEQLSDEKLEQITELYVKVFNHEPWNETWNGEVAKERLKDLINTPNFLGLSIIGKTI